MRKILTEPIEATAEADRTLSELDQATVEADQSLAELDQGTAVTDQTSRVDQMRLSLEYGRAAATRAAEAALRIQHAVDRDAVARRRDLAAQARDRAAESRDEATAAAAADRAHAASDRRHAAADRAHAASDRARAVAELRRAHLDELTGVSVRGIGQVAVMHEIRRARRSGEPLVLACVDVDELKQVNDRHGHSAGDDLLRGVATIVKSKLRSYDPIFRSGGDEFVCAFTNTTLQAARLRVGEIELTVEQRLPGASISIGLAAMHPGDHFEDLYLRGDADLYGVKRRRRGPRAISGAVDGEAAVIQ